MFYEMKNSLKCILNKNPLKGIIDTYKRLQLYSQNKNISEVDIFL